MGRTVGSSGAKTMEAIRSAGLRLIYEHGYEAMTLRGLAAEVGLQQGALYNYFSTKQELLFMLVSDHMHSLLSEVDIALKDKAGTLEKLKGFIAFHTHYHMSRKYEVFINYSELRSFNAENYTIIIGLRHQYEQKLIDLLLVAQEEGIVSIQDAKITAYGILAMLSGICQWFTPQGRLSRKDIASLYMSMALGALQVREEQERR